MQEYLFSYFLTQLGMDVLLLQCSVDIEEKLEQLNLSKRLDMGMICGFTIPQYHASEYGFGNADVTGTEKSTDWRYRELGGIWAEGRHFRKCGSVTGATGQQRGAGT